MRQSGIKGLGAIVMAAGLGKRMRSKMAKVLHPVAGRPMLLYAVELAQRIASEGVTVVVGHQADQVKAVVDAHYAAKAGPAGLHAYAEREKGLTAHVKPRGAQVPPILFAEQVQQLGTGHAVMQARAAILRARGSPATSYLILNGDTPLLTDETVRDLVSLHQREGAVVTILTAVLENPAGYGRVVRANNGEATVPPGRPTGPVLRIVEDRDAAEAESRIGEVNAGTYVVDGQFLFEVLDWLDVQNAQKEYYLTDVVQIAVDRGLRVSAMALHDPEEGLGINSREQLAAAERVMRLRIAQRWMLAGVTLRDPQTTLIDADVEIGQDTVLYPYVTLEGRTTIGQDCVIRSHVRVTDSALGDRVVVQDSCVITESRLEADSVVGPFAHLRPGTVLKRKAKVGNFVELKKAELGEGSKANHLSYLGDARIGKGVNIGAGTITCNYDGVDKHETVIGDEVFVGSDSQLIAPVTIGRGAFIAAGSTITEDVPADTLAVARARQVNRPGWAARRRALLRSQETRRGTGGEERQDPPPATETQALRGTRAGAEAKRRVPRAPERVSAKKRARG